MTMIDERLAKVGLLYEANALFEFEEIGAVETEFAPMPLNEFAEIVMQEEPMSIRECLQKHYLDHDTTGEVFVRPEMWGLISFICNPTESMYLCDHELVNWDFLDSLERFGILQSLGETAWGVMDQRSVFSPHAIFMFFDRGEGEEEPEILVWEVL
ncbi:hypothetical protein [Leucobacter massiliensis]|uniref:Uncharacterized protein n=1 Tax=Leucobacter massiliensis TaxID=1686285 RepID=A0A2S9QST4_9MICO|nr:hypothetical protein [Leucobacter massiliensis]PRI12655.1 hypothetical protein B4915_00220 [Leucobacter massiliensis]